MKTIRILRFFQNSVSFGKTSWKSWLQPAFPIKSRVAYPKLEVLDKPLLIILIVITSFSAVPAVSADDWESYEIVNRLLSLSGPCAPIIHENSVVFTANSDIRRIGIAFSHENFEKIYWYRQLLIPQYGLEPIMLPGEKVPSPYRDSGIQFYVHTVPDNVRDLEYRLIINGLWTIDPANPQTRRDPVSGLTLSLLKIPRHHARHSPLIGLPEGLSFLFKGPPGETVTVAGTFNNWDPFMYELREYPAGVYSITIPLPPGTYQYVFFHRGERYADPNNSQRIFSKDGRIASEIVIP